MPATVTLLASSGWAASRFRKPHVGHSMTQVLVSNTRGACADSMAVQLKHSSCIVRMYAGGAWMPIRCYKKTTTTTNSDCNCTYEQRLQLQRHLIPPLADGTQAITSWPRASVVSIRPDSKKC